MNCGCVQRCFQLAAHRRWLLVQLRAADFEDTGVRDGILGEREASRSHDARPVRTQRSQQVYDVTLIAAGKESAPLQIHR